VTFIPAMGRDEDKNVKQVELFEQREAELEKRQARSRSAPGTPRAASGGVDARIAQEAGTAQPGAPRTPGLVPAVGWEKVGSDVGAAAGSSSTGRSGCKRCATKSKNSAPRNSTTKRKVELPATDTPARKAWQTPQTLARPKPKQQLILQTDLESSVSQELQAWGALPTAVMSPRQASPRAGPGIPGKSKTMTSPRVRPSTPGKRKTPDLLESRSSPPSTPPPINYIQAIASGGSPAGATASTSADGSSNNKTAAFRDSQQPLTLSASGKTVEIALKSFVKGAPQSLSGTAAAVALTDMKRMQKHFGTGGPDKMHPNGRLYSKHPDLTALAPCSGHVYYLHIAIPGTALLDTVQLSPSNCGVEGPFSWRAAGGHTAGQHLHVEWDVLASLYPHLAQVCERAPHPPEKASCHTHKRPFATPKEPFCHPQRAL
jgi:hypothetical protein